LFGKEVGMGKSVAKLRRQARRAESRGGEDAAAAAAALAQRQAEAEAAAVAEAARIKAQKKRRHEANKEKLKQVRRAPPIFPLVPRRLTLALKWP
jgi:sugar (pentulose or hexulose) kinase